MFPVRENIRTHTFGWYLSSLIYSISLLMNGKQVKKLWLGVDDDGAQNLLTLDPKFQCYFQESGLPHKFLYLIKVELKQEKMKCAW